MTIYNDGPHIWDKKPDIANDEFACDQCGEVWDIEDSIKRDSLYLCPECAEGNIA